MQHRMNLRQRRKLSRRTIVVSITTFSFLVIAIIVFINVSDRRNAFALATGDFRSAASGNWNSNATWQKYNGTAWVAAGATPTSANSVIEIQSGHTITVSASVTADEIVVDASGMLIVPASQTLTIAQGTGTDLDVNGSMSIVGTVSQNASSTVAIAGLITISPGGIHNIGTGGSISINNGGRYRQNGGTGSVPSPPYLYVNSGGVYQHNITGSGLPVITWNSGSTCEITGVINSQPVNLTQAYYNLTWNCPAQTTKESITVNTVNGDFNVVSTGTGSIRLSTTTNGTTTVGKKYIQTGGTVYMAGSSNWIMNVTGDFVQSAGTFAMTDATSSTGSGKPVINVAGDFNLSGGIFDMNQYTGSTAGLGIGTLSIAGSFSQTGGIITETATNVGYGSLNFNKSGTQPFLASAGSITNRINFTVNNNSVLDLGSSVITGGGTFTLASGGGLIIGSPEGITSSGATGSVQVTGTRNFNTGTDFTFNGSGLQNTGNAFPSSVRNLTVNNPGDVILTNTVSVSGTLNLSSGNIIASNDTLIVGTGTAVLGLYQEQADM